MDKTVIFETFFRTSYPRLLSIAIQILNDEETARDIVSDAFEYAWSHFDSIPEEKLIAFLVTLVRSRSIDHLRHQQVHDSYIEFVQIVTNEEDGNDYTLREQRAREVHRILALLNERTRTIFIACYVHRKHYAEVAEEMGISVVAVKKAIMSALATFRKEFRNL